MNNRGDSDLAQWVGEDMSQSNWLSFALDIAEGINHLHSKEILHNDIKTDNVLVSRRKAVIVILGKVCFLKDAPAKKYARVYRHIAAEVLDGNPCCKDRNIFSVGRLLHQIRKYCKVPQLRWNWRLI